MRDVAQARAVPFTTAIPAAKTKSVTPSPTTPRVKDSTSSRVMIGEMGQPVNTLDRFGESGTIKSYIPPLTTSPHPHAYSDGGEANRAATRRAYAKCRADPECAERLRAYNRLRKLIRKQLGNSHPTWCMCTGELIIRHGELYVREMSIGHTIR
jgi:hypothetical protein